MGQMRPLASTQAIVEWDELPARAREIPANFDPLAEGVLMAHQVQAVELAHKVSILALPKGRRTGMTFAMALDSTITAASRKSAGGNNVFYIGDTKEKGLEFIGYCAKFARTIAESQAEGVSAIEQFLFEDQDEKGNTRQITAFRIRFASGFQITALSSRPANIRGLQGIVIIDEAAFHPDVQGVLDAATALLIWGGRIVVISSHNGRNNPFNQFCTDIQEGKYGEDAAVMTTTFDDAVGNGLYERSCWMSGEAATSEGKVRWYTRIRKGYGPRLTAMREELDAIPRDGNGVLLPGVWIEEAMREERPVLRLTLPDDFVQKTPNDRKAWMDEWIAVHVDPLLEQLNPQSRHVLGYDFARHRHFSTMVPMEIEQTMRRRVPFAIELHNVPTRQQQDLLWHINRRLPRWSGEAIDATGNGETIAEYTADEFGSHVHQIKLNRAWYGLWMPKLVQGFEDRQIDIPRDATLGDDLRAIENVEGVPQVVKETRDIKDPELHRHGDFAVAVCLAWFASLNLVVAFEWEAAPGKRDSDEDEDMPAGAFGGHW
ncbi:terminase large subunit domain-containing protein [Pseudomonas sp. UBA6323]|uniref:terminase large subunit domain-containing protein n=1 Tax=Pseudomonas sp. UBA6323 TaxID=1947329 RepID=UPI0025CDDDBC|nr:terminase family protein [Pseudomonas sp. UBA6323]